MLLFNSFNCDYKKINYPADGQLLRTAYFYSHKLIVSGQGHYSIAFEQHCQNPSAWLKKRMVLDYAESVPDPNFLKQIESCYEDFKQAQKTVKHETPAMIVARKKLEKHLDKFYWARVEQMRQLYQLVGYGGLKTLVDEDALDLIGDSNELPGEKMTKGKPFSYLLSRKWNEADEVYIFSHPFWEYAATRDGLLTTAEESDEEAGMITFRLPDLPKLIHFTTAELKLIKQEVFNPLPELRKGIEEWSARLSKEDFSSARFQQYNTYFDNTLSSAIMQLEEKINSSELLQQSKRVTKGLVGTENYLAITSARTVWDYMEWGGLVPKESMHIFEQHLPLGCSGDKAVLVFLSMPFDEREENEEKEEDSDKKSLIL